MHRVCRTALEIPVLKSNRAVFHAITPNLFPLPPPTFPHGVVHGMRRLARPGKEHLPAVRKGNRQARPGSGKSRYALTTARRQSPHPPDIRQHEIPAPWDEANQR